MAHRYYVALMGASRHSCDFLTRYLQDAFLLAGGCTSWLLGLDTPYSPVKFKMLAEINGILAHRPWKLSVSHIQDILQAKTKPGSFHSTSNSSPAYGEEAGYVPGGTNDNTKKDSIVQANPFAIFPKSDSQRIHSGFEAGESNPSTNAMHPTLAPPLAPPLAPSLAPPLAPSFSSLNVHSRTHGGPHGLPYGSHPVDTHLPMHLHSSILHSVSAPISYWNINELMQAITILISVHGLSSIVLSAGLLSAPDSGVLVHQHVWKPTIVSTQKDTSGEVGFQKDTVDAGITSPILSTPQEQEKGTANINITSRPGVEDMTKVHTSTSDSNPSISEATAVHATSSGNLADSSPSLHLLERERILRGRSVVPLSGRRRSQNYSSSEGSQQPSSSQAGLSVASGDTPVHPNTSFPFSEILQGTTTSPLRSGLASMGYSRGYPNLDDTADDLEGGWDLKKVSEEADGYGSVDYDDADGSVDQHTSSGRFDGDFPGSDNTDFEDSDDDLGYYGSLKPGESADYPSKSYSATVREGMEDSDKESMQQSYSLPPSLYRGSGPLTYGAEYVLAVKRGYGLTKREKRMQKMLENLKDKKSPDQSPRSQSVQRDNDSTGSVARSRSNSRAMESAGVSPDPSLDIERLPILLAQASGVSSALLDVERHHSSSENLRAVSSTNGECNSSANAAKSDSNFQTAIRQLRKFTLSSTEGVSDACSRMKVTASCAISNSQPATEAESDAAHSGTSSNTQQGDTTSAALNAMGTSVVPATGGVSPSEVLKDSIESLVYRDFHIQDGMLITHDFNWEEHAYTLLARFCSNSAVALDKLFRFTYSFTYKTLGEKTEAVGTEDFRMAIWLYSQRLLGIRNDHYDYSSVNRYLTITFKTFIKKTVCYPETLTTSDFANFSMTLTNSERLHVILLCAEARKQATLLLALRTVSDYLKSEKQ